MKKRVIGITVLLLLGIVTSSGVLWLKKAKTPPTYSGPVEKITLAAYAGSYGFIPFVAEGKGFFKENGLDVTINEYDFGLKALDALIEGKADIATAADFVLVSYGFEHADLRTIGSIARSLTDEIIARRDHGIEKSVDLKGRKIGVAPKTKAEYFLARFLIFNGIDYNDIKVVHLSPSRIVEAISAGEIDAASVWEPFVSEIKKQLGSNTISWPAQSDQAFYYLLIGRDGWIKKYPAAVERFLRAMIQAEEFMKKNPEEAQKLIVKRLNYELSFVQSIWQRNDFMVELPQELLSIMEDGAEWRIKNRLTKAKEVPNYLDFIYTDGLKTVKPEAMKVIQ